MFQGSMLVKYTLRRGTPLVQLARAHENNPPRYGTDAFPVMLWPSCLVFYMMSCLVHTLSSVFLLEIQSSFIGL